MRTIFLDKVIPKLLLVKALRGMWPGVVWSSLSPVTVADLPEPELPGARWLKVRNRMCGICSTDLSVFSAAPSIGPAALPGFDRLYLGHEVVGEVVEVGPAVTRFRPGDRVIMDRLSGLWPPNCHMQEITPLCRSCARGDIGLCENQSAGIGPRGVGGGWSDGYTAHETEPYPCPDGLTDEQATLVEPMSVALRAVLCRPPSPGARVLVVGAGVIGLLSVQAARAVTPDCHITALAKYPHQAEMARQCGADEILSPREGYAGAAQITGAKYYQFPLNKGMLLGGFDVIYDCVGKADTIEDSLRWARAGGAVVLVGIELAPVKVDLTQLFFQEVDLTGVSGHGCDTWNGERRHTYDWVIQLLREGKLNPDGLITHRFRFDDYRKAYETSIAKARTGSIKVVFEYP